MKYKLNAIQLIVLAYLALILLGAFLLCLPISSKTNDFTSFTDSAFTATSAVCVTGLVVYDTFLHWSLFGQIVILLLIQIGGIGIMTVISIVFIALKKQIGIFERVVLMQSAGSFQLSGVVKLMKKIVIGTLLFESIGAILLSTRFIPMLGIPNGIYYSIFHSVSAFCNAGFDLMGYMGQFSSMTYFYNDPLVLFTIMALIIIGGLGFIIWADLLNAKFNFKKYQFHTKLVLIYNTCLIFIGALVFFAFEYNNAFKDMNMLDKIVNSFFQSVTPRTAGFNAFDYSTMSESSALFTSILMFIGGNPGSTAGGVKTTTVIIVFISLFSTAKNGEQVTLFNRGFNFKLLKQANALFVTYISAIVLGTLLICAIEPFTIKEAMFEVTSAIGTVGLSLGVTTSLTFPSKIIIILFMFAGRVGAFTLFSVFFTGKVKDKLIKPDGKLLIG